MKYCITIIITLLLVIGVMSSRHSTECLDMNTVVDYEATDAGLLLITENGSGYFLEFDK